MDVASVKCAVCREFPTDPKKDADNATNLTVLGAKVVVDTEKETIAAAADEQKDTTCSEMLKSIFESKVCSPDFFTYF